MNEKHYATKTYVGECSSISLNNDPSDMHSPRVTDDGDLAIPVSHTTVRGIVFIYDIVIDKHLLKQVIDNATKEDMEKNNNE